MSDDEGAFPIRQEITIIPPVERGRVNWVCYEFCGSELSRRHPAKNRLQLLRFAICDMFYDPACVYEQDGLKVGDVVYAYDSCKLTVTQVDGDKGIADSGGMEFSLEFAKDSRKCWCSGVAWNKTALERIEFR